MGEVDEEGWHFSSLVVVVVGLLLSLTFPSSLAGVCVGGVSGLG